MAVNKVIYDGETLIDLSSDTVSADSLLIGYTAHDSSGGGVTGTVDIFDLVENSGVPELRKQFYRGICIGTSYSTTQKASIAAGTFDGMFLGDYWVIDGSTWRIVDFDYWYGAGKTKVTKHHLVIMNDTYFFNCPMNSAGTTDGGFIESEMFTHYLEAATTYITPYFTDLLEMEHMYTNGCSNGVPSSVDWFDIHLIMIPNELMIYGAHVHAATTDGSYSSRLHTESYNQLALFKHAPHKAHGRLNFWLSDIVNSTNYCYAGLYRNANQQNAATSTGCRPVFGITGS